MSEKISVVLFRSHDLRISDNGALCAAIASGQRVCALFVKDVPHNGERDLGAAAKWWLHHSLLALNQRLNHLGARLYFYDGICVDAISELQKHKDIHGVYWNSRYEAGAIEADKALKETLKSQHIEAQSFSGSLLFEPWEIQTQQGLPFKVFTPFWKNALARGPIQAALAAPQTMQSVELNFGQTLEDFKFLPKKPNWAKSFEGHWEFGEIGAFNRLKFFAENGLAHYADGRDRPDQDWTSKLSPALRFGEISPRQIFQYVDFLASSGDVAFSERDKHKFFAEIGWREFAYHLLFHFPKLATENFQPRFDAFTWRNNAQFLEAWQRGQTGYPIVDAGMRQLWQTGWMHNRVRMVVASFLIKHLCTDWRLGEQWFWDTLVDACPANNTASWQWVAGSGADAAPYFRIFNPVLQGEKFDENGDYVRAFVPELAKLPNKFIHKPWEADKSILKQCQIELGVDYPKPIVDHSNARDAAMAAFTALKDNNAQS